MATLIDYTDDPGGFAGEIPGSTPWPAATQGGVGAGNNTHPLNQNFFARITGQVTITTADTYTFRTFSDDGVYLIVDGQQIITDNSLHAEEVRIGTIALNPGVYPVDLWFFENEGEASLEFSFKGSSGSFGHVTSGTLVDSGVVKFNDVDLPDVHTITVAPVGTPVGSLTATKTQDTTGGGVGEVKWDYKASNDAVKYLGQGESVTDTFTITVNDNKGGTAQQAVTVVVNGVNDIPVITTGTDQARGNTKEDTDLSVSGQVQASDVDKNDTLSWSVSSPATGNYGTATVDGTGKWTYSLDNGSSAVQSLKQGETKIVNFTVSASDGKGGNAHQIVEVVVAGINDAAVISTQTKQITETNAAESVSGALTITDVDTGQASFNAQTLNGQYGNLSLLANGNWTYTMNGPHNEFAAGTTYTDTFTVSSVDGTTKANAVTVTILGTADGPTAVDDNASLSASTAVPSSSNVVYWVDWKTVDITGPRVGNATSGDAPVKVTGTITLGDGETIGVTYQGLAFIVQANEQKYVYTGSNLNNYEWTEPNAANLPYTSSQVNARPQTKDLIGLNEAFSGGGSLAQNPGRTDFSPRVLTFDQPVNNLFFAVLSMNANGYKFDQNFTIVSQGQGAYGSQEPEIAPTNFGNGQYGIVSPGEFHGVLKIQGSVDDLTWVSQDKETWNAFTIGTYGKANTASVSGNVLTNDNAGAVGAVIEVSNVNGSNMVGNSLTFTLSSGATLKVDRDGDYFYDDGGKFSGLRSGQSHTENVTYTVKDNSGNVDTGVLTIVVNGSNDAPRAVPDEASTAEDTAITIAVLANDSDADDGDTLTLVSAGDAVGGTVAVNGSNVVFTPTANFNGTASFEYIVRDSTGLESTGSVEVDVTAVNDAPTIRFLPQITNGSFEQPGQNGNLFTGGSTAMAGWTVTGVDVDYIPTTTWQPADGSFSLDLNGFGTGGVKQSINTVVGQTYTIGFQLSQNNQATSSKVRVTAGSTVKDYTFNADSEPTSMKWQGQTFTFTATNAVTELSFTSLNSGANGPALDNVVAVATRENTATTIQGLSVADGDAGSSQLNIQLSVAHGALSLKSTSGLVAVDGVGSDGTLSYKGSQASINAALANGVVYSPAANYSGADTLVATINDQGATGGGNLAATQNVGIQVYDVSLPQPISFWLADGNATDSILPANNGSMFGGLGFSAGRNGGQAFDFDGNNEYVSVNRELTRDFTIFGWLKTTQTAPTGTQFFDGDGLVYADVAGVTNDYGISMVGTKIAFGTGNPDTSILSTSNVNTGNWVQFAAVRDGATISLWINGVMEASVNTSNSGALSAPTTIIFGANTVDGRYFNGQMDDIQFFDRALTPVEIVGVMQANPV